MNLTARTLILDLLTTVRVGAMPVRAIVEAGALFGFEQNNIRVTLSKLFAEDRVARDDRGRYRLSPRNSALSDHLRGWRKLEEQHFAWRGGWVAVHVTRRGRGAIRKRRERALALLGFRELEVGLYLRPDNLRGGVEDLRNHFLALAAADASDSGDVLVYGVSDLDPATDLRARSLWDANALTREYRAMLDELAASRERLATLGKAESMVETFVVGAGVVRYLHFDPLLPDAILDPAPRRALVEAARQYDELGRQEWSEFLSGHGVPNFGSHRGWRASIGDVPDSTFQDVTFEETPA
jgi:phenylacetic acid degradation operon negative regulatory protein